MYVVNRSEYCLSERSSRSTSSRPLRHLKFLGERTLLSDNMKYRAVIYRKDRIEKKIGQRKNCRKHRAGKVASHLDSWIECT